jgi:pSer/pThr/pTyr-binding forkhead associated (FHA) protein
VARLIVEAGKSIGEEFHLDGEAKLGREASCALRIEDAEASREHALFRPAAGGFEVSDLGSKNGTFVNGERVSGPRALRGGDRVKVGGTVLLYVEDDARSEIPSDSGPAEGAAESSGEREPAPPLPSASARLARAAGQEDPRAKAIEAGLFIVVLVLVFFVASYAARVVLKLASS